MLCPFADIKFFETVSMQQKQIKMLMLHHGGLQLMNIFRNRFYAIEANNIKSFTDIK